MKINKNLLAGAFIILFVIPFSVLATSKIKGKTHTNKESIARSVEKFTKKKNFKKIGKNLRSIPKAKFSKPKATFEIQKDRNAPAAQNQQKSCINDPNPSFIADVTDISRISKITPPGVLINGNMFKSHSYLWIADNGKVPIYAPADAKLIGGAHYNEQGINQYTLLFQISCEVEFSLDHFLEPIEKIRTAFPTTPKIEDTRTDFIAPISFKAGELLGYTPGTPSAHNWDFGVYNSTKPDPDAAAYSGATDKDKRANCPYDYYIPTKRGAYRALFNSEIGNGVMAVAYCD